MFDLGLSKLALIGVVALVVIGPQKLPRVARMAGALFGRAQRYMNDVKAEVSREIELDGLRSMKAEFENAARNVETHVHENLRKHETDLNEAWNSGLNDTATPSLVDSAESGLGGPMLSTHDYASGPSGSLGNSGPSGSDHTIWRPNPSAGVSKRKNWRTQQSALPTWYKRASFKRTQVLSGAARVARHKPSEMRRPARFF
jgi:sec-independent protein translocase protein TatB